VQRVAGTDGEGLGVPSRHALVAIGALGISIALAFWMEMRDESIRTDRVS
jgi:hypothetical protein